MNKNEGFVIKVREKELVGDFLGDWREYLKWEFEEESCFIVIIFN